MFFTLVGRLLNKFFSPCMKAYFLLELVYVVGIVKCSGSLCCIYVYVVHLSGFEVGFDFH